MKMRAFVKLIAALLVLYAAAEDFAAGQNPPAATSDPRSQTNNQKHKHELPAWRYTTKAYEREAARLLLQEANTIARQLALNEKLPITPSDAFDFRIPPPAMGMLGAFSTANYTCVFSIHRKFAGVDFGKLQDASNWNATLRDFRWPASRLDTNKAMSEGIEIMRRAGADVGGLQMDCFAKIDAVWPYGKEANAFLPDYWITWKKDGETTAYIEFIEPTRSIRQLHVYDPKYMLREPVEFKDLKALLMEGGKPPRILLEKMGLENTNASTQTNAASAPASK